jgi:hypothetical protein
MIQDRTVDIATGFGLDSQGVGVLFPAGTRIFFFPRHPGLSGEAQPDSYSKGTGGSFHGDKAAGE